MKSKIFKFSMICLALSLCLMSCDKSTDLLEDGASKLSETPTMDDADFDPSTVEEYPSTLIATLQKDGHEIKFSTSGPPELQGILMEENLYGGALENDEFMTGSSEESTPFDVFLAMTDDEIEVPKSIAASATDNQLELTGRRIQKTSRFVSVLDENYSEPEETEAELRNCSVSGISCYPSYDWNFGSCNYSILDVPLHKYTYSHKYGWLEVRKAYAKISYNCGSVTIYISYWNNAYRRWETLRTIKTPGNWGYNKVYTHWVPGLVSQKVSYVPDRMFTGARYRASTQFVK